MPNYKEIVVIPRTTVNGKDYYKGETVRIVNITEQVAKFNNKHPMLMGCKYVKVKPEEEERERLFAEAEKLGLGVAKNISTKNLKAKIKEAKKPKEPGKPKEDPKQEPEENPEQDEVID